jgi:hypothetical protein
MASGDARRPLKRRGARPRAHLEKENARGAPAHDRLRAPACTHPTLLAPSPGRPCGGPGTRTRRRSLGGAARILQSSPTPPALRMRRCCVRMRRCSATPCATNSTRHLLCIRRAGRNAAWKGAGANAAVAVVYMERNRPAGGAATSTASRSGTDPRSPGRLLSEPQRRARRRKGGGRRQRGQTGAGHR